MRYFLIAVLVLVACDGTQAMTPTFAAPMGPDDLLEQMREKGVEVRYYEGTVRQPPRGTAGPNILMDGVITVGEINADATLFTHQWLAEYHCQPVEDCFQVGSWAVCPRSPGSFTEDQRSLWRETKTKMQ